jgi:hypothetical protein
MKEETTNKINSLKNNVGKKFNLRFKKLKYNKMNRFLMFCS